MKMKVVGLMVGLMATGVVASATTLTIADINATECQCVQFGDKMFDNISLSTNLDESTVDVSGSQVGDTVYINFGGPFATTSTTGVDFRIYYHVTALAGLITDIDQSFNLSAAGTAGNVLIGETVYSDAGRSLVVANSSVSFFLGLADQNDPPGEVAQGDQLIINPNLSQVWVSKDILVTANEGGSVGATIITQSFHQTAVPEPVTFSLMGVGLLGLGLLRKRIGRIG
jgi:hypothetical protein